MGTSDDDIRELRRSVAEPAAFRVVFERHHPAVRRYLHHRVGDPDGAGVVAFDPDTGELRGNAVSERPRRTLAAHVRDRRRPRDGGRRSTVI